MGEGKEEKEDEDKRKEEICVWRSFSHAELEKQYSPSRWSKKYEKDVIMQKCVEDMTAMSEQARKTVRNRRDVVYDPSSLRGKLDVFGEDLDGASPVLVYVHGGYWQEFNKEISAYLVPQLHLAGVVVVVVGYDLAPEVGVADIVREVRKAIVWTCKFASNRGSVGVVLLGWSAGGQLVTQVLSEEGSESGQTEITPYRDLLRGVITISGVFDLRPLVTTYVNEALKLSSEEAWALSPLRGVGNLAKVWGGGEGGRRLQVLVMVGEEESPEFKRQSKEYYEACVRSAICGSYMEVGKEDHFSIMWNLFFPNCLQTACLPAFIHFCCKG